ncbi:protein-disulfide reductase DsbD family protein [Commensalibacter oyaizuii]|uniref:Protein-disulfide reductase DsbD family protein n=1 Tax=Commensalibacter oyaizuii TaxID=3043873 RepID=A0ABT6Q0E3_9PROT|nr:protein-disulfide reductase DsbD domain-containing protein [Commensalibacter sp. TBRC 16381]MDI2090549.1 protein-disulfide reductase DsbD family protein [Commensalibacter sp. TBRC 16381]
MRYWIRFCLAMMGIILLINNNVLAKESNPVISKHGTANIISGEDHYDGRKKLQLGLRIRLIPGWHTYWKNPGDAGEPASVIAQVNEIGKKIEGKIDWPAPEPLSENGLMSYVYKGDVVLPFTLDLNDIEQNKPLHLNIKANWLVCADVCIPEKGEFTLDLPVGQASPTKEASLLQQALAKRPQVSPWDVKISPKGILWAKHTSIDPKDIAKAWFMPEKSGIIDQVSPQQLAVEKGLLTLHIPYLSKENVKEPLRGVLAVQDNQKHIQHLAITAPVQDLSNKEISTGLFFLLGSAFLGGVLLNLMPCVFPVIAMKLLSLSHIRQEQAGVRYKSTLAYTLGILSCFAMMAVAFVGLRWMGSQMGWGFQFQSVAFVMILCWLLFVLALNFLGVFHIQFSMGNGTASAAASSMTYSSDFVTGLLAVLVATPCTAPFMGVAVAGALNASLWVSLLIFIVMGLGLALPYAVFACIPILTRILPRPGLWMDILKQFLAFPLLLSCLWLAWVVYQHQQPLTLLLLLSGFIGLGFVAWLFGLNQTMKMQGIYRPFRILSMVINIGIIAALGISVVVLVKTDDGNLQAQSLKEGAIPFSEQKLQALRKAHQPVFVNMTASWCLTCMVNDKVALSSSRVQAAFKQNHIQYMVGDWTRYDKAIGDFLKAHGREGVPFYIYYPAEGKPKILPQILTPQIVLEYLNASPKK